MEITLDQVKLLVQEKRFYEAKELLATFDHPKRDVWLKQIAGLEAKQPDPRPVKKLSSAPIADTRSIPRKLTTSEERKLLPKGKPSAPRDILSAPYEGDARARIVGMLTGSKSLLLIMNFQPLKQPTYFKVFAFIYSLLIIGALVCFIQIALALYGMTIGHGFSTALLIISLVVLALLPVFPHVLVALQQGMYDTWMRDYEDIKRKFFEEKGTA